jgi:Cu/Ag efflux pump CusA
VVGLTWIVEPTFAWLARNRRLSKDYELKVQTSEAFIDLAAIRLMLKRLGPEIKLLKHPLRHSEASVKGVSEVASVGGFVKQYQVDLDPNALVAYNLSTPGVF